MRGKRVALLVAGLLLVLALLFHVAAEFIERRSTLPQARRSSPTISATPTSQDRTEPFSVGIPSPQELSELQALLDKQNEALQKSDGKAAAELYNFERMVAEMYRSVLMEPPPFDAQREFADGLRSGFEKLMSRQSETFVCDRPKIKCVHFNESRDEAIIYTRHHTNVGRFRLFSRKFRWWVRREVDGWYFYDFENMHLGLRTSAVMASAIAGCEPDRLPPWFGNFERLPTREFREGDHAKAEEILESLAVADFPGPIEALRLAMLGVCQFSNERWEESLQSFARAQELQPHMIALHTWRTHAANKLGRHTEAIAHGRKAIEYMGDDADVYFQIGSAAEALGRLTEAADAFRAGLRDDPDVTENHDGLRRVLPVGGKRELGDWLGKMTDPADQFEWLVQSALDDHDEEAAEVLADAMGRLGRTEPAVDLVRARLKVRRDDADSGISLFSKAILRVSDNDQRERFVKDFLGDMMAAGKALQGYRAAPDPASAFRYLAGVLVEDVDEKKLRLLVVLVGEHCIRLRQDPWRWMPAGCDFTLTMLVLPVRIVAPPQL
jgi:tetratricopeptide (TPR) repeat protein